VTKPNLVYHDWKMQPHIIYTCQKIQCIHRETHVVERSALNIAQTSSLKTTWIQFYEATLGQCEHQISRPLARGCCHISSPTSSQPATWSGVYDI
jgi:hypothetical protein